MNPINIWKITEDLDALIPFTEHENLSLLDLKKNEYDVLENVVFKIMEFHLKRLEMVLDDSIHVEFWLKKISDINRFHVDLDHYERLKNNILLYPLISCITYLNDHSDPTFISNVTYEEYKYKEFEEHLGFTLIFPEKGKHITFDGSKYHGVTSLEKNDSPRFILVVNIWNTRKPTDIDYYVSKKTDLLKNNINLTFIDKNDSLQNIELTDDCKISVSIFKVLNVA